jgi:hypothetical protein
MKRKQFGKPLAGFQIVQQRLVRTLSDLTAMQLYCLQMTRLAEQDQLGDTLAGLGKLHNTTKARAILAEARDLLGGNGILLDFHVVRHMVDLEAIHTFEGTETIQTLIVGRDITGTQRVRLSLSVSTGVDDGLAVLDGRPDQHREHGDDGKHADLAEDDGTGRQAAGGGDDADRDRNRQDGGDGDGIVDLAAELHLVLLNGRRRVVVRAS